MAAVTEQQAFLSQARSEVRAYAVLRAADGADCHHLHLLQMATEKLAKAIAIGSTKGGFGRTHIAFSKITGALAAHAMLLSEQLGMSVREYRLFIGRAHGLMRAIEELHPQVPTGGLTDGPNVEYPWQDRVGSWVAPSEFAFDVAVKLRSADGQALLKLIGLLVEQRTFERLFG